MSYSSRNPRRWAVTAAVVVWFCQDTGQIAAAQFNVDANLARARRRAAPVFIPLRPTASVAPLFADPPPYRDPSREKALLSPASDDIVPPHGRAGDALQDIPRSLPGGQTSN